MLTMIPLSMVFWNGSKAGHNFLLSFPRSCSGSSALVFSPLKRPSTPLRMLPAGPTVTAKERISLHCRNSKNREGSSCSRKAKTSLE